MELICRWKPGQTTENFPDHIWNLVPLAILSEYLSFLCAFLLTECFRCNMGGCGVQESQFITPVVIAECCLFKVLYCSISVLITFFIFLRWLQMWGPSKLLLERKEQWSPTERLFWTHTNMERKEEWPRAWVWAPCTLCCFFRGLCLSGIPASLFTRVQLMEGSLSPLCSMLLLLACKLVLYWNNAFGLMLASSELLFESLFFFPYTYLVYGAKFSF